MLLIKKYLAQLYINYNWNGSIQFATKVYGNEIIIARMKSVKKWKYTRGRNSIIYIDCTKNLLQCRDCMIKYIKHTKWYAGCNFRNGIRTRVEDGQIHDSIKSIQRLLDATEILYCHILNHVQCMNAEYRLPHRPVSDLIRAYFVCHQNVYIYQWCINIKA